MASSSPCAIILLGNSGVGKSFLANRLLDDDQAFESRFSARSVTHQTEWKNYVTANGLTQYIVGNIPGLVEANQKFIDENRIEIMKAFEQHPWAIVLFVFGHKNGRIPDEDIVAFTRINDAYEFPSKSLLIIVNGIPPNRPNIYEEKTKELLHELIHIDDNHIYFIEKATTDEDKTIIHRQLHEAIAKCEPVKHIKKHDIELLVDEISRLKREIHQRQNQLLAQEQKYFDRQKSEPTSDVYQERQHSQIITTEQISELIEKNRQIEESIEAISDKNKLFMMQYDAQRRNSDHDAVNKSAQRWINDSEWIKSQVPNIQVPPNRVIYTPKESRKREGTSYYITEIINPSDGHNSYNPNYPYQDDSLMYDCSYPDSQTTYYYHSNSAGDKSTHF
jgi:hypothetical protein